MSDEVQCVICVDFYSDRENDTFVVTACGHLYHKFCIEEELSKRPRCPVCSKSVNRDGFRTIYGVVPKKCLKTFKIAIVGDAAVGKTCLLKKYCNNTFYEHEQPTTGSDVLVKTVTIGGEEVKLIIWDTAGQEVFRAITPQYIRDSQGVVFVYDTLHSETLENCWEWSEFVRRHAPHAVKILLGARKDLTSCSFAADGGTCPYCSRSPSPPNKCHPPKAREVEDMSARMEAAYFETSAKMDINVDVAFRTLAGQILQNRHLVREAIRNDPSRRRIQLTAKEDEQPTSTTNGSNSSSCC